MEVPQKRERYQNGSLTIEKRKTGPSVWVFRWRQTSSAGSRKKLKRIIGTKLEFPTRTAALKQVGLLQLEINQEAATGSLLTIAEVVEHYRLKELLPSGQKTARTVAVYEQHLRTHILPRWGFYQLVDVKPPVVEDWFKSMTCAPATKAKTRNVMSALYQHAMRYSWATSNPIRLVRQSSKRVEEPAVLTGTELRNLMVELPEPSRTIVRLAAASGMRRGEIFGLKWEDVDFTSAIVRVVRSLVDQVAGDPKTAGSRRHLPLDDGTLSALVNWRAQTLFAADADWIFASPACLGAKPFWPNTLLNRHIVPAARRVGITKQIGWHTFRRSFATLLQSEGNNVKVTQELLGHSSPVMTLGTYAQAVTADKRQAQSAVAGLF